MEDLVMLRKEVDWLDSQLLEIIKKRLIVSREIGRIKKKNRLSIRDRKREKEVLGNRLEKSSLEPKFVKKLFKLLFKESRRVQKII